MYMKKLLIFNFEGLAQQISLKKFLKKSKNVKSVIFFPSILFLKIFD